MSLRLRVALVVAVGLLAFYLGSLGLRAAVLLGDGDVVPALFGAALVVLAGLGAWVVAREIAFGLATARLGRRLAEEGGAGARAEDGQDGHDGPRTRASGRPDRVAADAAFAHRRSEVEAAPGDWRGWYRLALAYDAAGDRRRGRAAARQAVRLARVEGDGAAHTGGDGESTR